MQSKDIVDAGYIYSFSNCFSRIADAGASQTVSVENPKRWLYYD